MISSKQQHIILHGLAKYNPIMVGVFGSYSRNEQKPDSDLDILVNFAKPISLLDLVGIELELSEKLGVKVDLITQQSISPKLEKYILKDMIKIA